MPSNRRKADQWNQRARDTNNVVIETAREYDVRSYIFAPCIVYGEGEGFGNRISIQTVAIVQAAKALRTVYDVNADPDSVSFGLDKVPATAYAYTRSVLAGLPCLGQHNALHSPS